MKRNCKKTGLMKRNSIIYRGEDYVRFTGDTSDHAKAQLFAWEAHEKDVEVHLLAEPTKLELLQKEYEKKKEQFKTKIQSSILSCYGGEEYLQAPPKSLLLAQSEEYVEYSRSGKIIKGTEKEVIRSEYEEGVYVNNHTSVWGSFWKDGQWGYKCCHSFIKNSYCLGKSGQQMNASTTESTEDINDTGKCDGATSNEESVEVKSEEKMSKKAEKKRKRKDKLKEALKAEEANQENGDQLLSMDDRKRPYNSMFEVKNPTEGEIEAYYLKRRRLDDPMNQFM